METAVPVSSITVMGYVVVLAVPISKKRSSMINIEIVVKIDFLKICITNLHV